MHSLGAQLNMAQMKSLKERFFEDNPNLTDFERMAWEFSCEVQDLWHSDPRWAEGVTEMVALIKKLKKEQFKSPPPERENV